MTEEKAGLPAPYDQDLSRLLTRIKRKTQSGRTKVANSLMTASLLRAGCTLIERHLSEDGLAALPTEEDRRPYWSGLRFLTQNAVAEEMQRNPHPFLKQRGKGALRSTWESHHDYLNDLMQFFFAAQNYDPQYGAGLETRGSWLLDEDSFAEAIDRTTFYELEAICAMPLFRLQMIMSATAEPKDGIREAIEDNYRGALDPWKKYYEMTFAARGFRLRPGVTMDELADMLAALTEGLALRRLGDPSARILSDGPAGNLFGKAVIGLLRTYLEPVSAPTGRTAREEFEEIARRARPLADPR